MARYIDAELIQKLKYKCIAKYPLSYVDGIFAFAKEIADIPTADVVEVVRCKDCEYKSIMSDGKTLACIRQCAYKKPTDFCSYGERRPDNAG